MHVLEWPGSAGIFSAGYAGIDAASLIEELVAARIAVVIDVRATASGRAREFCKTSLATALAAAGIQYEHARFAGTPREIRQSARWRIEYAKHLERNPWIVMQLDSLISPRLHAGEAVCILCLEAEPHDCHRSLLLRAWVERFGANVVSGSSSEPGQGAN